MGSSSAGSPAGPGARAGSSPGSPRGPGWPSQAPWAIAGHVARRGWGARGPQSRPPPFWALFFLKDWSKASFGIEHPGGPLHHLAAPFVLAQHYSSACLQATSHQLGRVRRLRTQQLRGTESGTMAAGSQGPSTRTSARMGGGSLCSYGHGQSRPWLGVCKAGGSVPPPPPGQPGSRALFPPSWSETPLLTGAGLGGLIDAPTGAAPKARCPRPLPETSPRGAGAQVPGGDPR